MSPQTLTARCVFPVDGPPLPGGTVTIEGERIIAVEPHGRRAADVDLGNVALIPGFVNAHTHLDLSGLRGKCPPSPDFTGWLRTVIQHRRTQAGSSVQAEIQAGLAECLKSGTTLVGDIASQGASWPILADAPIRSVVFYEMLGLPRNRAKRAWSDMLRWHKNHPDSQSCHAGLSPHAPFSVNASIIRAAARTEMPVAIHLAESSPEVELLCQHSGPFVEFLGDLGVWDPSGLASSVDWIIWRTQKATSILYVHGNFLPVDSRIGPNGTIIYCPRTHAAFGHPPHPFRDFLARGVRVALGTDSLASNPDLSVLAEARFLHGLYPDFPGATLLRMATLSGAEALGWADQTGSLTPGKSADLVVLPLPDWEDADPHALVLGSELPVQAVMVRGQWVRDGVPLEANTHCSPEDGLNS